MSLLSVEAVSYEYRRRGKPQCSPGGLRDVDFMLESGDLTALLGPNGAGKSTMLKLIAGILTPTAGRITVNGLNVLSNRSGYLRSIGILFGQKSQLWWDLPLEDSFKAHRHMYKLSRTDFTESFGEVVDALDLTKLLSVQPRRMSLGQRVRSDIAVSLLHRPELLLLDEPSLGLDAISRRRLAGHIKTLADRGTSVIVTSHETADIEELVRRIIFLRDGVVTFDGAIDSFLVASGVARSVVVEFATSEALLATRETLFDLHTTVLDDRTLECATNTREDMVSVMSTLGTYASTVSRFHTSDPDLTAAVANFSHA